MCISDERAELSNIDLLMPITAADHCSWSLQRGPGFKLISPESNNSKLK